MTRFPPYRPPHGGPHYWRTEESGVLAQAVVAYLDHVEGPNRRPSPAQLALLVAYLDHWIYAPCWKAADGPTPLGDEVSLEGLRGRVKTLSTVDDVRAWLRDAQEIGIDPI